MTRQPRLPRAARWLLRMSPVPREAREEVHGDLIELFMARRRERGAVHAHARLYRDVVSLWSASLAVSAQPKERRLRTALLRDAGGDLRYAARLFARQPAILLLTVIGLALGLGVSTATFSIMTVALRGEGVRDSARVPGILRTTDRSVATVWSYDEFLHLRHGATRMQVEGVLTETALVKPSGAQAEVPTAGVAFVSGGFFGATGARMTAGRPLEPTDERHAGPPPVVVSHVFWTSRLNRDPAVIGRRIRIGRAEGTVVGVAERGFSAPNNRLLWMPLTAYGSVYGASARRTPDTGIQLFGRLLPGVEMPDAEAQLSGVAATLPRDAATSDLPLRARLDANAGLGRVSSSEALGIAVFVFAVIGIVLLLACANVATVLVSTAITRDREMAVRAAIGATRSRIVRQLVTESLALGVLAAAIGLLVALWGIPIVGTMIEAPAGADLAPDFTVYLFLGIVTLVTGVLAGLAPAWHGRGVDLLTPLKGEGAGPNRVRPRRLRSMLVVTQAAASVLLIVLASLFVRATFRAATVDVGFEPAGLYAVSPGLGDPFNSDGAAVRNFWRRAIPELQGLAGIAGVAITEPAPFGDSSRTWMTRDQPARVVNLYGTGPEYFDTVGLRLVVGRTYSRSEADSRARVAVVSEGFARSYWQDQSPVGKLLPRTGSSGSPPPVIIGVVSDAITTRLHDRNVLAVYEPIDPEHEKYAHVLIRVAPGSSGVIQHAMQRLRAIDRNADVTIHSIAQRLEREASRPRMMAALTGIVGMIAIALCVIGLYGLTASVVGQRRREMAVRAALGAERRELLRLLMWDSLRPVVIGLALGAGAALLAGRVVLSAVLFGVSPQDPVAYAGAAVVLLAAAVLAVLVPTRRAAAVDAAFVLRQS